MESQRTGIYDQYLREMHFDGSQIILHTDGILCGTTSEVVSSRAFEAILFNFLDSLIGKGDPILDSLSSDIGTEEGRADLLKLLRHLSETSLVHAAKAVPGAKLYVENPRPLYLFVEKFYDFWRSFDRYLVCHSEHGPRSHDVRPYRTFTVTTERLKELTRGLYRDICENITGEHCRIYRQVSAGADVGLIAVQKKWNPASPAARVLEDVPFIRQVLINPPLIIDPPENTPDRPVPADRRQSPREHRPSRKGSGCATRPRWAPWWSSSTSTRCSWGWDAPWPTCSSWRRTSRSPPGPTPSSCTGSIRATCPGTANCRRCSTTTRPAAAWSRPCPGENRFGYFGYLKKMTLTLHNILMMKRGRMPFHGAMAVIHLKDRRSANVLVIGDTATGKSETLEAFRLQGRDNHPGDHDHRRRHGLPGDPARTGACWATERRSAPSSASTTCSRGTPSARWTAPSS